MAAAMDVLGCLPGPPTKHNQGAADALDGEVFAYGVAAAIAVLDVRSRRQALLSPRPSQWRVTVSGRGSSLRTSRRTWL